MVKMGKVVSGSKTFKYYTIIRLFSPGRGWVRGGGGGGGSAGNEGGANGR